MLLTETKFDGLLDPPHASSKPHNQPAHDSAIILRLTDVIARHLHRQFAPKECPTYNEAHMTAGIHNQIAIIDVHPAPPAGRLRSCR
jgi:hypothetical protein